MILNTIPKDSRYTALAAYAEATNQTLTIRLDSFNITWWGKPPKDWYLSMYITVAVAGTTPHCNGEWFNSLGYTPYGDKYQAPHDGYSEEEVFSIFLLKEAAFTIEDCRKAEYTSMTDAVVAYWILASKCPTAKLLLNTKKSVKFIIGKTGGTPIFSSFEDIKKFFYGEDNPDDGESLHTLLTMYPERVWDRIKTLPNARGL